MKMRVVVFVLTALMILGGLFVSPFNWPIDAVERDPIPVDALPDAGENQQIVFTSWPGRSPQDVEDQITYPLTSALLGVPGVKTVRSSSAFGFSNIYVIFKEDVEFYWSRSRVLEKLASLSSGTLPRGVTPTLGPDATALGQIFWYTLEGQNEAGEVVGGWDADELRSVQDWYVRYALQAVDGVSEVASIGGFVREYQVDVDPEALRANNVSLSQVVDAVRKSNLDIGARTLEINGVEYMGRGIGFVQNLGDLEQAVVVERDNTPLRIKDVAHVLEGPALRRGALDDEGAPAVGGVVVARYGENPLSVIAALKSKIAQIEPGLPTRELEDGTVSQVKLVPFYDRSPLIKETLSTLSTALYQQFLIALLVVVLMLRNLRSSLLISALLPLGVLGTFLAMKLTGVDANIMALGGIAIAIGTMVDIGIVFVENISVHLAKVTPKKSRLVAVRDAASEVAPAIMTSVMTTIVSFLPVLALSDSEFRLFAPLAITKTFSMLAALAVAIVILPCAALIVFYRPKVRRLKPPQRRSVRALGLVRSISFFAFVLMLVFLLTESWLPLGPGPGLLGNLLFVGLLLFAVLGGFRLFERFYPRLLSWVLKNKAVFLILPTLILFLGTSAWLGFERCSAFLPEVLTSSAPAKMLKQAFPGIGREYMPTFDEGSYLYMPTMMPHASIGEVLSTMSAMDAAIAEIPEVDRVVGKLGRAESALDPAPVSMIETVITYFPEYSTRKDGTRVRNWRPQIRSQSDIWDEIVRVAERPGLTTAPKLMPMNARLVMLQSGMRAPMGIKVKGPSLEAIETFSLELERVLRDVPSVQTESVFADRVVGKPYIEIDLDRQAIGRFGLSIVEVQETLQVALGGIPLTRSVEGRRRFPIRVRYMREERDSFEALGRVTIDSKNGQQVPLTQLADIRYQRGPQVIKTEDTFLTSYVLFDRKPEIAEVNAVEDAAHFIEQRIKNGDLKLIPGVSFEFAGTYKNQLRSEKRLLLLVPVALAFIFVILYLQFRRTSTTAIIFSGVAVAAAGGFTLLWLYGQPWFLNFSVAGTSAREIFHVGTVNLSVAVWIGFIALVGIATDDGVVMSTYLKQHFKADPPMSRAEVRARTMEAGTRRVRPCLMTTATTILALLPVITSQGRGADIMMPMALPAVGGMAIELMTLFVVPVLYCAFEERRIQKNPPNAVA